jgi:hypothetical protein
VEGPSTQGEHLLAWSPGAVAVATVPPFSGALAVPAHQDPQLLPNTFRSSLFPFDLSQEQSKLINSQHPQLQVQQVNSNRLLERKSLKNPKACGKVLHIQDALIKLEQRYSLHDND